MRTYDTCRAEQITKVTVGRSAIVGDKITNRRGDLVAIEGEATPESSAAFKTHNENLAKISNDDNLTGAQKREQTDAENKVWNEDHKKAEVSHADARKAHEAKLADISSDASLNAAEKREATDAENKSWNDDYAQDQQDIIHIVLAGGEKRSILRSDLTFSPAFAQRDQSNFPAYARRRPSNQGTSTGQYSPSGQFIPHGVVLSEQMPRDGSEMALAGQVPHSPATHIQDFGRDDQRLNREQDANESHDPYPEVGDWYVEDFDTATDKFVQKIYDNATFSRYFKASLN
jgi:hypothetical protein